jgi:fibronectin-binding autotransporter adhesin
MAPQFPHTAPTGSALPRRTAFVHGLYIFILLLVTAVVSRLGATIVAGDISIVGYNATNPDEFRIVFLSAATAGDTLNFTDNGWQSTGAFRTGEGVLTYTVPAGGLTAGTTVNWLNGQSIAGTGWSSNNPTNFAFNASGDSLIAYTGTSTLVYALQQGTTWDTNSTSASTSSEPTSTNGGTLVSGVTTNAFGNINGYYSGAMTTGTKTLLQVATANATNWTTTTNAGGAISDTNFKSSFTVGQSANLYWDANGTTAGTGGTGTWDATTNNMFKSAAADSGISSFRWVNSSTGNSHTAIFGGTAGTVSVASGGVTASGLQFDVTGYTVQNNTITLSSASTPVVTVTNAGDTATLSSVLAGTGGLTKSGAGVLTIGGTNTYTGATAISSGVLKVASVAANGIAQPLGQATSAITLGGSSTTGTLEYSGGTGTLARDFTVSSSAGSAGVIKNSGVGNLTLSGTLTKDGKVLTLSGGTFTVSGKVTGASANSDLVVDGATVSLTNATNDYNGPTIVQNSGKVIIGGNESYLGKVPTSTTAGNLVLNNGTLNTTADVALSATRGIAVGPTSGTGSGTLQADSGTTMTVNGVIANNPSGTGSLSVTGAGTVDLKSANTYSGGTTVSGGTLLASNSSGSATGSGTVSVNGTSSTILGGTGTISGATTVSLGQIKPGTSSGTGILNFGSDVTLSGSTPGTRLTVRLAATNSKDSNDALQIAAHLGNGTFATWVLGKAADYEALNSGSHDKLIIGGSLNLNSGGQIVVDNTTFSGYTPAFGDIIDLFDFSGAVSLNLNTFNTGGSGRVGGLVGDLSLPALSAGLTYNMTLFNAAGAAGIIIVVPEPSRAVLALFGLGTLFIRRRRTQNA